MSQLIDINHTVCVCSFVCFMCFVWVFGCLLFVIGWVGFAVMLICLMSHGWCDQNLPLEKRKVIVFLDNLMVVGALKS